MNDIKNEYRINFYNDPNTRNIQRVFIYADNDYAAMDIVINTYDIPIQYIVSSSLYRKNVKVIIKDRNIYENFKSFCIKGFPVEGDVY